MAWFSEFRNEHGFTSYPDNQTPVTLDKPLVAVTYFCVLLAIATIIATLGIRGRERWSCAIRACYAVAIGSIILVCICGHGWLEGQTYVTSPYLYRSNLPFQGRVAINVALHGTNITLDGVYKGASGTGHVYFVESLPWADYGHETDCFTQFLQRGLPDPVLKVIEFLTVDEGGLRWGRSFHSSGHYAGVLLWTAFAFWIICNVLLFSVVIYGAYMFTLTGVSMILACVAYHSCQNSHPLVINFGEAELHVAYGWCFWLTLIAGMITLLLGILLIVLDHFVHDSVSEFFHLEKLDEDEGQDYCFKDEQKFNGVASFMDRRGSMFPPTDMRRGSIFMEPNRRPSWYSDNMRRAVNFRLGGSLGGIANTGFEGENKWAKQNPVYGTDDKVPPIPKADYSDEDVKIDMEKVCAADPVQTNNRKPSLATLKEHRENHANERLSSASTSINHNKGTLNHECVIPLEENSDMSNGGKGRSRRSSNNSSFQEIPEESPSHGSNDSGVILSRSAGSEITAEVTVERYSRQNSTGSNRSQKSGGNPGRSGRRRTSNGSVDSGQGTCDETGGSIQHGLDRHVTSSRPGSGRSTSSR